MDGGKLYVPERTGGKIFVINTKTFKVEKTISVKGDKDGDVRPSDVAIDHSQNEIYVSSQGVKGENSGVSVYDATTHEFKKFIPFGTQALSLDNDEANDLVYVSDFGTGKVGVIDGGAADKLIAEVAMNGGKANDLVVLPNGSVVAVDKQAGATATVPLRPRRHHRHRQHLQPGHQQARQGPPGQRGSRKDHRHSGELHPEVQGHRNRR